MAELLFISPGKGGVFLIAAAQRRFSRGDALFQKLLRQQQTLFRDIVVYGVAGLLPEPSHNEVLADVDRVDFFAVYNKGRVCVA